MLEEIVRTHLSFRHMASCSRTRGLTLIELMVVVSVIAILAALAGPSFLRDLEQRRLESAAEAVYQVMRQARVKAMNRSDDVYVYIDTGSDWKIWLSPVNPCATRAPTNGCLLDNTVATATSHAGAELDSTSTKNIKVLFRTTGFQDIDSTPDKPSIIVMKSPSELQLNIIGSSTGALRICAANANTRRYPPCN